MEEKRRDTGSQPPPPPSSKLSGGEHSAGEPVVSRRRGGSVKRKSNASSDTSPASSTPLKRQAREKLLSSAALASAHNGPLTRARQLSDNSATPSPLRSLKDDATGALSQPDAAAGASSMDIALRKEELEAMEAQFDARFEAIRSRHANAHVVPVHAGWFSWKKVHQIEKQALPSFFNGKSENRNPEKYMEIRNWIMKKFLSNPNINIELEDLSDFSVEDLDVRQEVMEFLDHWGLINYHPFPQKVAADASPSNDSGNDMTEIGDSLIEKLYRFETEHSCPQIVQTGSKLTPAVHARLFPESSIAEELAKQEGPSVGYHCNSCSADCSCKRYHCQKEADFDLCSECYNNGKFGSGMSPSDFILMEPAEASGSGSGKWTDQETLLLLEALELYKENWNEIAEHVATKTKAQCILHFLQMPIEDSFLDSGSTVKGLQENASEAAESNTGVQEVQSDSSPVKSSKLEDSPDANASEGTVEDVALNILKEAFETMGTPLAPEHSLSFGQAGNPVMALALFLLRLVGSEAANMAARSSLKLIHGTSPGMQLATRHSCFLEDAEDDVIASESPPLDKIDPEEIVEENTEDKNHNKENASRPNEEQSSKALCSDDSKTNDFDCRTRGSTREGNSSAKPHPNVGSTYKLVAVKEPEKITEAGNRVMDVRENSVQVPNCLNAADSSQANIVLSPGSGKELTDTDSAVKPSEYSVACKGAGLETDSALPDKEQAQDPVASVSVVLNAAQTVEDKSGDAKIKDLNHGEEKEEVKDNHSIEKLRGAAISTVAAAVVKAKLLAEQEEDEIKQLAAILIDKQLRKLEVKMSFFTEMENAIMRVKEHLDQSRQKLYQERAHIIATRLGLAGSSSRLMAAPSTSTNRMAANFANLMPRPSLPMSMTAQRPISRPVTTSAPPSSGAFVPSVVAGQSALQSSSK
ncbi:hypothetical protein Droror1_Dr00006587 [Drosera rotundifolia]